MVLVLTDEVSKSTENSKEETTAKLPSVISTFNDDDVKSIVVSNA